MVRRLLLACVVVGLLAGAARPALAQGRLIGGGIGYAFDEHADFLVLTGLGWIPVNGPNITFKPIVVTPRFQVLPGLEMWQVDLDAVWDIPLAPEINVRPYMGLGVGLSHSPFQTAPLFNFDAGFRYKKPTWSHQFAFEIHYSAGLDYGNTMVMNFLVLFPFGKR